MRTETTAPAFSKIAAAKDSSPGDFDFLVGKWHVRHKKLNRRLAGCDEWTEFESVAECARILNGFGNHDVIRAEFEGRDLSTN